MPSADSEGDEAYAVPKAGAGGRCSVLREDALVRKLRSDEFQVAEDASQGLWECWLRERGVSLFDEALPPGFIGENLTIDGPLEHEVFVGDEWHFPDCVLRVAAPREPCFKFNAVMGFAQAGRAMAVAGCCGYYLAVDRPGTIAAGQTATLVAGQRGLSIAQAFAGKFAKHAR